MKRQHPHIWATACFLVPIVLTAFFTTTSSLGDSSKAESATSTTRAAAMISKIDAAGGICVLLDAQPAGLALALSKQSELTIYLQLPGAQQTESTRRRLDDAGMLGTRIYVEQGDWARIHLADNLADVVIVPAKVAITTAHRDEMLRVLRPGGKLILADATIVKPLPDGTDDWSHPYHGPDNNPQSTDRIARAPYLTQFLAKPWYVPFPVVSVASGGKVFQAFGHIGYKERDWPWVNSLVAINGYNGTLLWKRSLQEGFNIHRNTIIATPEILYQADGKSCKLIDTATGKLVGQIVAPPDASGPAWKWMAMEDGVLYGLVGKPEHRDETVRGKRTRGGWPWKPMTSGYDKAEYPWGFGRTFFAIDPKTKKVLWTHSEKEPVDTRGVCMKGGRIYYYSPSKFMACLDARKGKPAWRTSDEKLLEAIGKDYRAQDWRWGFSSTSYIKCSDEAVYLAGPQRTRMVAISAVDGRLLWQYPNGNFRLVLRDEGLYALGTIKPRPESKLFDPLSGKVLAELDCLRGNCTRVTGMVDCIFARGHLHGGTLRLSVPEHSAQRYAMMRPPCMDGVIAHGGMLYWGPWMCDCSLSLVGNICFAPVGDFDYQAKADTATRLETNPDAPDKLQPFDVADEDWPTYRADNSRRGAAGVEIPKAVSVAWTSKSKTPVKAAAPITAGGLTFLSGSDGVVRAVDAKTGKPRWKAFTGGPIVYPPAIENGRLLVGSGDGWIYAFEAATGKRLWRFRAAPVERKIPVYGRLSSTWPVASGVLVDRGTVYAAAGIASHDGTHVYALDAPTGNIRWQNNTSSRLRGADQPVGVSVQGHLLLHKDRLYMAGGNVVSPAAYDIADGRCLSSPGKEWEAKSPRGRELFLVSDRVVAFDQLLYSPQKYWQGRYFSKPLAQVDRGDVVVRGVGGRVFRAAPQKDKQKRPEAIWDVKPLHRVAAMALGKNAVVVAGPVTADENRHAVMALDVESGKTLWNHPLDQPPVSWGIALGREGRVNVALVDGKLICLADAAASTGE
ncbi:MAG: PQQ-binding-like beta-propeller repeat protein [Planctomycetota bacterium]|nr:PQQ-binding-like beta-propeller repeat protein [Planctomycetota bacterium]